MTQSDSPDFEFDISDLEVERDESAPSEQGVPVSGDNGSEASEITAPEGDNTKRTKREIEEDAELDAFVIDDIPDTFSPPASDKKITEEPAKSDDSANSNAVESPEVEPKSLPKIEKKQSSASSRALGEDDLGADVFAEIENDSTGLGLDDVIDDLMDEVEEFEAGGFVELDEEGNADVTSEGDGLFKMSDPDDSLSNSVDPNAEDEEESLESPAFPSPPMDFEIPADSEPEQVDPVQPEAASPAPQSVQSPPPPTAEDSRQPRAPQAEAPRQSTEAKRTPARPVEQSQTPAPSPHVSSDSNFEIPADPAPTPASESVAEAAEPPASEEPVAEPEPEIFNEISADDTIEEPAAVVEEPPPAPAEGHENVLFDAAAEVEQSAASEDEEAVEAADPSPVAETASEEPPAEDEAPAFVPSDIADEEEEDLSDLLASVEDDLEDEDTESLAESDPVEEADAENLAQAPASPEAEASEVESSEVEDESIHGLTEVPDEEEEDLSDLLASVSDELETSEVEKSEEPEAAAEDEQTADPEEAVDSEPKQPDADAPSEVEDAEEEVEIGAGLTEVPDEEEEDLSDLLASVEDGEKEESSELPDEVEASEELNESEPDSPESEDESVAESVPGLTEVPEDGEDEDDIIGAEPEDEVVELPTPDGLIEDASDDSESLGELIGSEEGEIPGLVEVDEETAETPEAAVPGLVEVEEEDIEDEPVEAVEAEKSAPPTAEELLMQAGGLLNANMEKPADGASALLDVIEDEEEEIVAMPSPEDLLAEASEDDEEVVALPDPESLLTEEGEAIAVIEDDDEEDIPAPGNVADRAGDLPPPPPAPVEIIDAEPPEEDAQASGEKESPSMEPVEDDGLLDPFSAEISLDDFDDSLDELDGLDEHDASSEEQADAPEGDGVSEGEEVAAEKKEDTPVVVEMPKPSLLWRITHSMTIAAGLVLIGAGSILGIWKQEILEYYEGRDIDGSILIRQIEMIGTHALSEFDESGLYRMQWVDSEIRQVSENEIRLHALVGAQLRENLYKPVLESKLDERFKENESKLLDTLKVARDHFPEEIGNYPDKPWNRLYEISAHKDEVLPLRVVYGLTRDNKQSDWEVSRIKVSGYKEELVWPEGEPKFAFGEKAYDVNSLEFSQVLEDYRSGSEEYIARVDRLKMQVEDGRLALKRENDRQRERVRMALTEGAFFNGLAIFGEDADVSRDAKLVITEVRNDGNFVKGVVSMKSDDVERSKHFVGSLEFETTLTGREQGFLSFRTVSIDAQEVTASDSPFFESSNVSRMRLKADGFRLEGDSSDLSFRFTRSL